MEESQVIQALVWLAYTITLYSVIYWILIYLEDEGGEREVPKRKKPRTWPTLTVIIPAYNEERSLQKTIDSVRALNYPEKKLDVVVVDDGSKDNTKKIGSAAAKKHANVRFIHQHNQGKAAALNHALKKTRSKYFACLDADSFVEPASAKAMIESFEADDELEICTPVMLIDQPKNFIQKFQRLEYLAGMFLVRLMASIDSNYVAPGPFSMYRTQTIKDIGGFDEDNLVEDQEIAYRIQVHHKKIRQVPDARVHTIGPDTFKKLRRQRNRWMKGSLLNIIQYRKLLFNKEYGDFGSYMMPITLSAFLLAIIALTAFLYYTLVPLAQWIRDLWLVGFDIQTLLANMTWNFSLLDPNYLQLYIIWLLLLGGTTVVYLSSRTYSKRIREYGSIYILPYFFVYFLMLSIITVEVLIEVALKKKQKW